MVNDIAEMQAKKIAAKVYRNEQTFSECLARSLVFYGWKLDAEISCWVKGDHRVTVDWVMSLRPEDCRHIEMITSKVASMTRESWEHVEMLLDKESEIQ